MFSRILLLLVAMAMSVPAQAKWYEASSENFVIYADDSEKDLRAFAETLERFHLAMELVTGRDVAVPSPSSRVTIYAVGNSRDVQELAQTDSRFLQGFYISRAARSAAFVQDMRSTRGTPDAAMRVLLHEYAHHFLISSQRYAMPRWMNEGAAEFFASVEFERNGDVIIGKVNQARGYELFNAVDVSLRELLDADLYEANRGRRYDAFYGRSWLLYHYLTFNPDRQGQLTDYWVEIASGTPPIQAGQKIFGDLDTLEQELDRYLRSRRWSQFTVYRDMMNIGEITIRPLSEGHSKILPVVMQSRRGVDSERAPQVYAEAHAVAAHYPDDPAVQAALAEAAFDAGELEAAVAAADRALAADPRQENAYVQKGLALFEMADLADDVDAAVDESMKPFRKLNAMENDHPLPLIYFFRSYGAKGKPASDEAVAAIQRASELAPFDLALAYNVGVMYALDGQAGMAGRSLSAVAYNPHGGSMARHARHIIDYLNSLEDGAPIDRQKMMEMPLELEIPDL